MDEGCGGWVGGREGGALRRQKDADRQGQDLFFSMNDITRSTSPEESMLTDVLIVFDIPDHRRRRSTERRKRNKIQEPAEEAYNNAPEHPGSHPPYQCLHA